MLGVQPLARTGVHPTKRSLITRSKGFLRYNVYPAFRPSEFLCPIFLYLCTQIVTWSNVKSALILTLFVLVEFYPCRNCFWLNSTLSPKSSLYGKTTFAQKIRSHLILQFHTHTLTSASSNSGKSNNIASFTNSSICPFSRPSLKLFTRSAHSMLDRISDTFNLW